MATLSNDYISSLPYTQSSKLHSVDAVSFYAALAKEHTTKNQDGMSIVRSTLDFLERQKNESFSGMKEFKERIHTAIKTGGTISVDDQKYIANIANGVAAGVFK